MTRDTGHGTRDRRMLSGLLLVDKRPGEYTGDILRRLKRQVRGLKLGHAGTLDPMASGLVQVLIGSATKLLPFLKSDKEYIAGGVLGVGTDSLDACGRLERREAVAAVDRQSFRRVLASFRGESLQVPPALSAKKIAGLRSYHLFRQGKRREPKACRINIYALSLLAYHHPVFLLRVRCSAGTYVRSLIRDIGSSLGSAACLYSLRRTKVGPFRVEDARVELTAWRKRLLPSRQVLPHLGEVSTGETGEALMSVGCPLEPIYYQGRGIKTADRIRVISSRGELLAIAEMDTIGMVRVKRLLN